MLLKKASTVLCPPWIFLYNIVLTKRKKMDKADSNFLKLELQNVLITKFSNVVVKSK